jgi:hypothetical protein
MTLLDLDERTSWEKIYLRFVKRDPFGSTLENAISSTSDDDLFRILGEIQKSDEYVSTEKYLQLKNRCYKYFLEKYTHVAAYHACRPIDNKSYLDNGIKPANGYGNEKIWFFISRTRAIVDSHYLEYGSELIRSIATRLGDMAIEKLSKVGTPIIFQCSVPISWLKESIARIYSVSALTQLLIYKRKLDDIDKTINGAFCIEQTLPKEQILKVIDETSF